MNSELQERIDEESARAEALLRVPTSWEPVDLRPILDGTWERPRPTVGKRTDGIGVLYVGYVHAVASETEAGKTWLALVIARDVLEAGGIVVYLDYEDDESAIVGRLLSMGVSRQAIAKRIRLGEVVHVRLEVERTAGAVVRIADVRARRAAGLAAAGVKDRTGSPRELRAAGGER